MDNSQIEYMRAGKKDVDDIYQLIKSVFDEYVAPAYREQGIQEFYKYIQIPAITERLDKNHFILIAKAENEIAGVIEVRNFDHVSMLFVSTKHQKKGIANTLLGKALELCKKESPKLEVVSVNSSPNAVHIYERMGFEKNEEEKETNGIRFTPMTLKIDHN